jgi:hypothetical protein
MAMIDFTVMIAPHQTRNSAALFILAENKGPRVAYPGTTKPA